MRASFAVFALAALTAAEPVPIQAAGVSSAISPSSTAPAGCSPDYRGSFQIAPVNVSSSNGKRDLAFEKRQDHNVLTISLSGGILTDSDGRTGYVASNYQFQFDDPPQAGAIYTAGFSVCSNGRLAVGDDTTWQKCLSGPGSTNSGFFYNLYLKNDGGQCIPSYILAEPYGQGSGPISGGGSASTTAQTTSSVSSTSPPASSSSMSAANSSSTIVGATTKHSNGTATASSSSGASGSKTTTGKHTAPVVTHQTTVSTSAHGQTTGGTAAGGVSSTTGGGAGGASASSSSAGLAAPTLGLRTDVFGLAAGLVAYAML